MIKYTGIVPICPKCNQWTNRKYIGVIDEGKIRSEAWLCNLCENEFIVRFLSIDHEYDPPHGGSVDLQEWVIIENIIEAKSIEYYSEQRAYVTTNDGKNRFSYILKDTLPQFIEYAKQNNIDNQTIESWL